MKNTILSTSLRLVAKFLRVANLGNGSTWPGHLALKCNPNFIEEVIQEKNIIPLVVAGTNGKTTTARMLQTVLEQNGFAVFQNDSGANLLNGVASTLILHGHTGDISKPTYAIFEIDENALPIFLRKVTPKYLLLLNLFRDQLDRYGEVRTIAMKWKQALSSRHPDMQIIANGDDPQIVGICDGLSLDVSYFGLGGGKRSKTEHASDSTYCPRCGKKLHYNSVQFSHLGDWKCLSCGLKRPKTISDTIKLSLVGSYNAYNAAAAYLTAQKLGIEKQKAAQGLSEVTAAFGRQEEFHKNGKTIKIFLSKNPTGMNESLRAIKELGGKYLLFVLNDRIPDGTDVSWIWDVDFEDLLHKDAHIFASGDRAFDMGLRIKYAEKWQMANGADERSDGARLLDRRGRWQIEENLERALGLALVETSVSETLYILPTYSAMLNVRKLLTGRKIL